MFKIYQIMFIKINIYLYKTIQCIKQQYFLFAVNKDLFYLKYHINLIILLQLLFYIHYKYYIFFFHKGQLAFRRYHHTQLLNFDQCIIIYFFLYTKTPNMGWCNNLLNYLLYFYLKIYNKKNLCLKYI